MLSQSYHNSKPFGNSDKYYTVIQFWNRLGLQARKNKNSDHLEHFLSFPGKETVGRVFAVENLIGIQFYFNFAKNISPKLKGGGDQPDVPDKLIVDGYASILTAFLDIPDDCILTRVDGFAVFSPISESTSIVGKGGQN